MEQHVHVFVYPKTNRERKGDAHDEGGFEEHKENHVVPPTESADTVTNIS